MKTTIHKNTGIDFRKIFLTSATLFAFSVTVSAQVDNGSTPQEEIDDKIQQEPPRENQRTVERTATEVNQNANANARAAEEKLKTEKEKSTGKESENPAATSPRTVKPAKVSEPIKQRN